MPAFETEPLLVEEPGQAFHALGEHVDPLSDAGERKAVGVILVLRPARAERRLCTAAGEVVDRGDGVREHRGMPIADRIHQDPDPHARRRHRQGSLAGHRFERPGAAAAHDRVEVVPHGDPPETQRLYGSPVGQDVVHRRVFASRVHAVQRHPPDSSCDPPGAASATLRISSRAGRAQRRVLRQLL